MDEGTGLNIMYIKTFYGLGIALSALRPRSAPFHGIIPGYQAYSLRRITFPVTFGDPANFLQCYNAILGRPCYAKFMAVPNYT